MSKRQHAASNDSGLGSSDVNDPGPPDGKPPDPQSADATAHARLESSTGGFDDVAGNVETATTPDDIDASRRVCVIGGCPIGRSVAERLADKGVSVSLVQPTQPGALPSTVETTTVDSLDGGALEATQVDEDTILLAVHPEDATNLLFVQHARTRFDPNHILVRVNDPSRMVAYEGLDVETIDVSNVIGRHIAERL